MVKTFLEKSTISGMGCIAGELIPKGTVVWKFQENFDVIIDEKQFKQLPRIAREFVLHFCYYSKKEGGYIVCMDNAKYTNHSPDSNTKMIDEIHSIATKDINDREEITGDYFYFDELAILKL